jgi:hypothetical protein
MIPRTLVPLNLVPVALETDATKPRRVSTVLDERTLIPARLPFVALETRSAIPDYVPLDVLSNRVLVPRDALKGTLELPPATEAWPVSDMDERVAVPLDAHPGEIVAAEPVPFEKIEGLLEPDVLTTGDVNLMPREVSAGAKEKSPLVPLLSVAAHVGLALIVFLITVLFPAHQPTQAELDLARNQLGIVYLPNSMFSEPKSSPKPTPSGPPVHVSPKILREAAPPVLPAPEPLREPPKAARELPSAPLPSEPAPRTEPPRQVARLESPKELPDTPSKLILPRLSAGREIEESARNTGPGNGGNLPTFGPPIRRGGGGGIGGGGGGRGGGVAMGGLEMLTPTEGVDFDSYLRRVYYKVKQNWENVMPESVWLGEKGIVVLEFRIMRDGTVPPAEPNLMGSNAREPLERAAISSIRGSNPFEPLPPAFSGPFILLRYTYLYNIPPEAIH